MKLLISAVCLVACAHAMSHGDHATSTRDHTMSHSASSDSASSDSDSDKKKCDRIDHKANKVYLDGRTTIDYKHFNNAAFIQKMVPASDEAINSDCIRNVTYGFDSDKVTVWAGNGCEGTFLVDYLKSYCTNITLDSRNEVHFDTKKLKSPCYENGASFSMKLLKENSVNKCNEMDALHSGIGVKYFFKGRQVAAADGCWALFEVCEVGLKMADDEMMMEM